MKHVYRTYEPPYCVIPMPINEEGHGPAAPHETVKTLWEIWDATNQTVSMHDTFLEAVSAYEKLHPAVDK